MLRNEPESGHIDDGVWIVDDSLSDCFMAADVLDDGGKRHGESGADQTGSHARFDSEMDWFASDLGSQRENGAIVEDDPDYEGDDDEGAEGTGGNLEGGRDVTIHGFGLEKREGALADVDGHHYAGGPDRNYFD